MMTKATVTAGLPKAFLDFAAARGADCQLLLQRSNISPTEILDADNRIPLESYVALLMAGIELCHEPATNPYLSQLVTRHADEMLSRLTHAKSMRGHVEDILIRTLRTGAATIGQVANELGVSRQTLFRKLKAEGVTFQQVLDELRHRLAVEYLSNQKTSTEVAYLLGFSDQAAFSRAFKRWTGLRPSEVRKKEG
jgi:AraC-like DNA-binding protein